MCNGINYFFQLRRSYTGYKFAKKMLYRRNLATKKNNISKKIEQH